MFLEKHLHHLYKCITDFPGMKDAVALIKVWLHQRELDQVLAFSASILDSTVIYLRVVLYMVRQVSSYNWWLGTSCGLSHSLLYFPLLPSPLLLFLCSPSLLALSTPSLPFLRFPFPSFPPSPSLSFPFPVPSPFPLFSSSLPSLFLLYFLIPLSPFNPFPFITRREDLQSITW